MLKAAVIGAGWYGAQNHIPTLAGRSDVVLDGVCRLGRDELERVRRHFGFAFASEDYRELLARRPDIVVVSTPHHLHYAQARDAIEGGAHVLVEKPMTLDPAEAWDMVARARAKGVQLLVANGYHYLPGLTEVRDALLGGAVGTIEHVLSSFVSATRTVFHGDQGLDSWRTTFFRPSFATWQDPANGGGFAYGQMSHSIALMLWLTGLTPVEVAAQAFGLTAVDLCDAGALRCAGGAVVSLSGAGALPQGHRGLMRLIVTGSEGVMTIELDRDECRLLRHDRQDRDFAIPDGAWVYHCRGPVEALAELAQGRGANLSPGAIGAATTATIEALLRSARDGGRPTQLVGPT